LRRERVQKCNQVSFFLRCKTNIEAHVIEDHHIRQGRGRTVVKVRCAACKSAENGTFPISAIPPFSGDKGATGSAPTIFSYAQDGNLLEENNNGVITDYVCANGVPLVTLAPATGKLNFLHTDHLGTPQLCTYQPFGTTGLINGSLTQSLRLPG